jgi:hypothetical protein
MLAGGIARRIPHSIAVAVCNADKEPLKELPPELRGYGVSRLDGRLIVFSLA